MLIFGGFTGINSTLTNLFNIYGFAGGFILIPPGCVCV